VVVARRRKHALAEQLRRLGHEQRYHYPDGPQEIPLAEEVTQRRAEAIEHAMPTARPTIATRKSASRGAQNPPPTVHDPESASTAIAKPTKAAPNPRVAAILRARSTAVLSSPRRGTFERYPRVGHRSLVVRLVAEVHRHAAACR